MVLDKIVTRKYLAMTAGLLPLMLLPRDDCLLRSRESTGASAAGSNISAELEIFTCRKIAMREAC